MDSASSVATAADPTLRRRRWPATLWIGLAAVVVLEGLLFSDVYLSGRGAVSDERGLIAAASRPGTTLYGQTARLVADNMTPFVWPAFILLLEGIVVAQTGTSPVRRRPHHFALLCLASVSIWCVFDWINFAYIHAWTYLHVPRPGPWLRYLDLSLSFGAIVPGMLLSGQAFLNLGWFDGVRSPRWRMPPWAGWAAGMVGALMFAWPFVARSSVTNLTLWTSLVLLLDPINLALGRPSVLRDWQNGWYGRTLAAFAGGLACGLLWEFWNYWALSKWVYHLPFLGRLEHVRYFEMPLPGLLGFIPFGLECWVMWQTIRIPLDGLAEPLPDERSLV